MMNMVTPLNCTSYGYTGCYLLRELLKTTEVAVMPISHVVAEEKFRDVIGAASRPFFYDAPCLKLWHQHDLTGFTGRGESVGFTIFELDQFSDKEKHSLGYPDHIITCSEWGRQVIIDQTERHPDTVHVVPLGVDHDIFKPRESSITDKTIFLNAGKWEYRKGHDILIKAFEAAFERDDAVELWMMPHNFFLKEEQVAGWVNYYKTGKLGDKVRIFPRVPDHESAYNIMAEAHCGVFPARAEGWNLELLEMMAIGKPVIATNNSAHTEYANSDNTHFISTTSTEVAFDGVFFDGRGNWAELGDDQMEQLIQHMRYIHKNHIRKNPHGINTGMKFTWKNSCDNLLGVMYDRN